MTKILYYVTILCVVVTAITANRLKNVNEERLRLERNQRTLLKDAEIYRTANGQSAAACEELTLKNEELKANRQDLLQEIAALQLKVRRLKSVSRVASVTETRVTVPLNDTVLPVEPSDICADSSNIIRARALAWNDSWTRIEGVVTDDSATFSIQSTDTLIQVVHRVPKKWWFLKWGTKAIRQEITSKNPHSRLVYTEYITIK